MRGNGGPRHCRHRIYPLPFSSWCIVDPSTPRLIRFRAYFPTKLLRQNTNELKANRTGRDRVRQTDAVIVHLHRDHVVLYPHLNADRAALLSGSTYICSNDAG